MDAEEYDKGEHVKEVFAYFGRAYYLANVFEQGLALAALHLDFLTEVKEQIRKTGPKGFDRSKYEAEFDAFMVRHEAMTLGNLIKRFRSLASPDDAFQFKISLAKDKRDLLAHHYFRERSVEFVKRVGRDGMIEELKDACELFASVDRDLTKFMESVYAKLGIQKDILEAYTEQFYKSIKDDDDD